MNTKDSTLTIPAGHVTTCKVIDSPLTEPFLHRERLNIFRAWRDGLYIVCADQHFPIQHKPTIDAMMREAKKLRPDGAIACGDCLDMRKLSTFRQNKSTSSASELSASKEFHNRLVDICGRVIYIAGANHELRLIKRLLDWAGKMPSIGDADIPIFKAIQDARDWYLGQGVVRGVQVVNSPWVQIGDAVFSHIDRATKVAATTTANIAEHFLDRRPSGLPSLRWLFQAHMHRYSFATRYGVRCWTLPGQTMRDDYSCDGKAGGSLDYGFMSIRIKDGRVDWNGSKMWLYDVEGEDAY